MEAGIRVFFRGLILRGFRRNIEAAKVLTDTQIESIHRGTLEVLEETGYFMPRVADRLSYQEWINTGKKSIVERAKERMD